MSDISDLLGRIEQETKCINWAITELKGRAQRIFIDRRMKNLKNNYARLNTTEQETEIIAAVKLPQNNVPSQLPQNERTIMERRKEMASAREQASRAYATWLFAVTKLTVSQAQTKLTTDCFEKLQAYHRQFVEILGEEQAAATLAEIMGEVHEAAIAGGYQQPATDKIPEQLV